MPERLTHFNSEEVPKKSVLSHAVKLGELIFVSGQVGLRLHDNERPEHLREEIENALDSLESVLREAGSSTRSVVRTNCYLRNLEDIRIFDEIYSDRFEAPRPARTTTQALLAGDLRFEIDAVAVVEQ